MDTNIHERNNNRMKLIGFVLLLTFFMRLLFPSVVSDLKSHWTLGFDGQGGVTESCLPWSLFFVRHDNISTSSIHVGTIVQFRPPQAILRLYGNVEVIKIVAAVPGDKVKILPSGIWIDGKYWGRMWLLPYLMALKQTITTPNSYIVPPGFYLTLGTSPDSYDSRYWGLTPYSSITGIAHPL